VIYIKILNHDILNVSKAFRLENHKTKLNKKELE